MPFNFPVLLMCWTVAASLAAGNACIVKPAEATSLCTLEFMKHFEILPAGLVSCLPGDARVAQTLISSKDTHAVAFTGSVAAGCEVGAACARMMKPCVIVPSPPSPSSSPLLPASSLVAPLPPLPVFQPRLPVRLAPPPTRLSSPPRSSPGAGLGPRPPSCN